MTWNSHRASAGGARAARPERCARWLTILLMACCGCSPLEDERFSRPFTHRAGYGPWRPVAEVPRVPQEQPAMVIWETSLYGGSGRGPSVEQREAARDLIERSYAAADARGWDLFEEARSDGFAAMPGDKTHYANATHIFDDAILDPTRPEFLMYYDLPGGKELVGFMFLARTPAEHGPQIGGPLTVWHHHVWSKPQCLLGALVAVGSPDRSGACARGEPTHRSPEMMHVWLVEHPDGPFATSMRIDPTLLEELLDARVEARGF